MKRYYEKDNTRAMASSLTSVDLDYLLNHLDSEDTLVYLEVLQPVVPGAVDGAECVSATVDRIGRAVTLAETDAVDFLFVSEGDDQLPWAVTLVLFHQDVPAGDPGLGVALERTPSKWGN